MQIKSPGVKLRFKSGNWRSFHFKKRFNIIGWYVARSITKSHFLLVDSGTTTIYSSLNTNVQWNVSIYLKIIRNLLIRKYFYNNDKKTKKTKNRSKFWSDTRFLNWKILNELNKVSSLYFSTCCQKWGQTTKLKPNQALFYRACSNLTQFFWSKIT